MRSTCGCRSRTNNGSRSEEHTSELQSQSNLVCRLLLEKKKKNTLTAVKDVLRGRHIGSTGRSRAVTQLGLSPLSLADTPQRTTASALLSIYHRQSALMS